MPSEFYGIIAGALNSEAHGGPGIGGASPSLNRGSKYYSDLRSLRLAILNELREYHEQGKSTKTVSKNSLKKPDKKIAKVSATEELSILYETINKGSYGMCFQGGGPKGKEKKKKGKKGRGITDLFGKYNAGYIGDENTSQLFPDESYDKDGTVRYMVEGVGVWLLGMINSRAGAISGGLAVTIQGQKHILKMRNENYLQNGEGMGIYAINVNAPGAFPRASLFNAVNGSFIGWHYTTVKGAPTMQYHIYLMFLQELRNVGQ